MVARSVGTQIESPHAAQLATKLSSIGVLLTNDLPPNDFLKGSLGSMPPVISMGFS